MGSLSLPHLIILALVVLVLFGRGRISEMMGDFGKGLSAFKKGVAGDGTDKDTVQAGQPGDSAKPISAQTTTSPPSQAHQDNTAKV